MIKWSTMFFLGGISVKPHMLRLYVDLDILAHLGGYSGLSLSGILAFVYAPYAGVPELVAQHVATVFHLSSGFVWKWAESGYPTCLDNSSLIVYLSSIPMCDGLYKFTFSWVKSQLPSGNLWNFNIATEHVPLVAGLPSGNPTSQWKMRVFRLKPPFRGDFPPCLTRCRCSVVSSEGHGRRRRGGATDASGIWTGNQGYMEA